ncbi:hypothetical protein [Hyphomonas sp.]|uniref:hypothetical protein n=1 Tax=Hyphomonas sp. TaxID=87 RepID=UPI003242DF2C
MKKLPHYFLANFMGMERDRRREALYSFCITQPGRWSYSAFNQCTSEILGAEGGLFGKLEPVSDAQVEQLIRANCRTGMKAEFNSNLQVAKALVRYVESRDVQARYFSMPAARFGAGEYLRFWNDLIVEIDGERLVLCIDPKRSGLNLNGMRVVQSIAQSQVIEGLPQLSGFKPAVLQFPKAENGTRYAALRKYSPSDFFSYDELHQRYVETYSQYADVLEAIRNEGRGTGETGTLI